MSGPPDPIDVVFEVVQRARTRVTAGIDPAQPYLTGLGKPGPRLVETKQRAVLRNMIDNCLPFLPGGEEWNEWEFHDHTEMMVSWALRGAAEEAARWLDGATPDRLWQTWGEIGRRCSAAMDESILRQVFSSTLGDDGDQYVKGAFGR